MNKGNVFVPGVLGTEKIELSASDDEGRFTITIIQSGKGQKSVRQTLVCRGISGLTLERPMDGLFSEYRSMVFEGTIDFIVESIDVSLEESNE